MNGTPFLAIRWSDPGSFKANGVRKGYRGTFVHPFSQKGCTGNSKSKIGTPNVLFSRVCKDKNEKMVYESGMIPYPYTREYKGAKMVAKMLYRLSIIARAGRAPVHGRGLLSRSPTPYSWRPGLVVAQAPARGARSRPDISLGSDTVKMSADV